jgi:hypothetical protein
MMTPEAHDDVELSDRENDTFLPSAGRRSRRREGGNVFIRWLPRRLRTFVETLSTIKVRIQYQPKDSWTGWKFLIT